MEQRIIAAGFGGQGVLLIGQLLAYAGMIEGKNVTWLPSYGAEMRGGTANCSVVVSADIVCSPIVDEPDAVLVMNLPSLVNFERTVKTGGALFYNSSLIDIEPERRDITVIKVPCNKTAMELGNERVANMIMLGAYIAHSKIISPESVILALGNVLGEKKAHLLPINREALARGAEFSLTPV